METSHTDFDFEVERLGQLASGQANSLDSSLNVQFYRHAELNSFRSAQEGRKIFDDKIYIRIMMPANRLNVVEREATPADKMRFSKAYTHFIEKGEQLITGTPLAHLPSLSPGQVLELRALKVETVEQLASIPDTTAQLLGVGGLELKKRASVFLNKGANVEMLATEIAELKRQLEERVQKSAEMPPAELSVRVTENSKAAATK